MGHVCSTRLHLCVTRLPCFHISLVLPLDPLLLWLRLHTFPTKERKLSEQPVSGLSRLKICFLPCDSVRWQFPAWPPHHKQRHQDSFLNYILLTSRCSQTRVHSWVWISEMFICVAPGSSVLVRRNKHFIIGAPDSFYVHFFLKKFVK